ncbi:MAG: 23S rRNA (adenine(2503)-C(2))-methyltransferase RlmN [Alphaproteobacteria bacterium]|nr:23S rRNA (adenine(2503)-C(2))-methyltransferase RlmN [Alphaproteobacteria bacterium]
MATVDHRLPGAPDRTDLRTFDRAGLHAWLAEQLGVDEGLSLRVFKHLWQDGRDDPHSFLRVRRDVREHLARVAGASRLQAETVLDSADGTRKFLWRLHDGHAIESVLIPDEDRLTLCMSTQVGCAMGCTFCLTGDLGLIRHLTAAEIALQPMQVQATLPPGTRITNLVLMGMGEPLHNLENLVPALSVCLDDHALNFSHRRITVSTVGLVPKMAELAAALPVNLAVSLNSTTEEQRRQVMPITRRHSMAELLDACRAFPLPSGKRITFEYVMFRGFNDSLDDAARLLQLLRGIPSKVNLIPYNENPDRPLLQRPTDAEVKAFQHVLVSQGMSTSIRTTRGIDISAACGQLGKARQQLALAR